MKCPKCNGDKGQWDIGNYHWYPCDSCHETGEVDNQPKGKLQSDGMPERIWANPQLGEYEPICYDLSYTEYLRADKVREVVRLHEEFRDLLLKYRFTPGVPDELNAKAEEIDNLQSALFPEGLGGEE
jgi:hypothetical protein